MVLTTIIQLDSRAPAGQFSALLGESRTVHFDAGESLPQVSELGSLIVLGGRQNAYDPALTPVAELLRAATAAEVPTLGICLGAQLLATAHGGRVEVNAPAGPERGIIEIRTRPAAATDPLFGRVVAELGRDFRAISMHHDSVTDLPSGATWLAASRQYPYQAFRIGSAVGIQFHPEADAQTYGDWLQREIGAEESAGAAEWLAAEESLRTLATAITGSFPDGA